MQTIRHKETNLVYAIYSDSDVIAFENGIQSSPIVSAVITEKDFEVINTTAPTEFIFGVTYYFDDWYHDQAEVDRRSEKESKRRLSSIYRERDRLSEESLTGATSSKKSLDYLLMRSAKINNIRGKGQRPLSQDELDEENALELMLDEVERIHTVADEAVANGTAFEDIDWGV